MAISLGTKGAGGKNLVRDKRKYDRAYDQIRWKSKAQKKNTDKVQSKPAQ